MRSFFAFHKDAGIQHGFFGCLHWAEAEVGNGVSVVTIATARPDDKNARIVAEVTESGVQRIKGGRLIPVKTLKKLCLPDD